MFIFYTIAVVAILLGAGWDRSGPDSDRKSSFSGPRRGLRGRPGTSGGARRVPARPNLGNRRQLLRNDPLRPPFLEPFGPPTPPQPPGPYTLEYLRFEGIPPFDPHASCPPGSADCPGLRPRAPTPTEDFKRTRGMRGAPTVQGGTEIEFRSHVHLHFVHV